MTKIITSQRRVSSVDRQADGRVDGPTSRRTGGRVEGRMGLWEEVEALLVHGAVVDLKSGNEGFEVRPLCECRRLLLLAC